MLQVHVLSSVFIENMISGLMRKNTALTLAQRKRDPALEFLTPKRTDREKVGNREVI